MRRFRERLTAEVLESRHLLSTVPFSLTMIGDSIGTGLSPADASRIGVPVRESYRPALWDRITAGFGDTGVEFVGATDYNPTDLPPQAIGHSTYRGFAAYSFFPFDKSPTIGSEPNGTVNSNLSNADGWATFDVDAALIQVGTNDVFEGRFISRIEANLRDMIDEFRNDNSEVDILLGTLPPFDPARPNADMIPVVNDMISDLVNPDPVDGWAGSTIESQIHIVDHFNGQPGQPAFDLAAHSGDGVHPNSAGDQLLADNWWSVLEPIIAEALVTNSPPAQSPPAQDPPAQDPPAQDPPAQDPPAQDPPDDEAPPRTDPQPAQPDQNVLTVSAAVDSIDEGARMQFLVHRAGDPSEQLTVHYRLGGSATHGEDYTLKKAVVIPAGENEVLVEVATIDDNHVEPDETVSFALLGSSSYLFRSPHTASTTIVDNDRPPVRPTLPRVGLRVSKNKVDESKSAVFTFIRDGEDHSKPLELDVRVQGTARLHWDYEAKTKRVVIPAGKDRVKVRVKIRDDKMHEADETIIFKLQGSDQYKILAGNSKAQLTIIDNDPAKKGGEVLKWLSDLGDMIRGDDEDDKPRGLLSWFKSDRDDDSEHDDRRDEDRDDD